MRPFLIGILIAVNALGQVRIPGPGGVATPGGGGGSFAFVQAHAPVLAFGASNCVIPMGSNVTAGNLLFISITLQTGTASTFTISDGVDTFLVAVPNALNSYVQEAWYLVPSTTRSETITITASNSATKFCAATEFSGNSLTPLDQTFATQNFTTSPTVSTTGNLSQNNELVIGMFSTNGGNLTGVGTGYTAAGSATSADVVLEYKILSGGSGATQTATAVASGAGSVTEQVVTFEHL